MVPIPIWIKALAEPVVVEPPAAVLVASSWGARFSALERMAAVSLPRELVHFYGGDVPASAGQCTVDDLKVTLSNYAKLGGVILSDAPLLSIEAVTEFYAELRAIETWDGRLSDGWPRHWLPLHEDGIGDIYALALERDRAMVVCVQHRGSDIDYVADWLDDYVQQVRVNLAVKIYSRLTTMSDEGRQSAVKVLEPDGSR